MGEVLEYEAGAGPREKQEPRKVGDIQEVLNYRRAIMSAEHRLNELPLSGRLLRDLHRELMAGVRGQNKAPGDFRKIQNWIGPPGCSEEEARFVPAPPLAVPDAMAEWERFIHRDYQDTLVQLALVHAEFEAIHPFLDGNGRLGRMLIPLFLFDKKLLRRPTFYLSGYLEARRDEYYERLLAISRDGDWTGWCTFFLNALIEQAGANTDKATAILALYEEMKSTVPEQTHSQYAIRALDFLFIQPVFNSTTFVRGADIPEATARRILRVLRDEGVLTELRRSSGSRPAIFAFSRLLNIAEGSEFF